MALKVKKTKSNAAVDSGEYLAVITSIEEDYHPEWKENYVWKIKIKDATLEGEPVDNGGELVELRFFSGRRWTSNEKNKINQILQALGKEHDIGDELDLEECIGKKLRVIITDKKTEKGTFSKVSGFLPLKKKTETKKEEKPAEKKSEKKEEKSSSSDDDNLFNFSDD